MSADYRVCKCCTLLKTKQPLGFKGLNNVVSVVSLCFVSKSYTDAITVVSNLFRRNLSLDMTYIEEQSEWVAKDLS